MTDTKAWIVGSPKECGPYWVEWGCGARCATLVTPDDVWFDIDSGFEQMDHKVRRHCKITVSDPPPLPEKPAEKPVKEKLPRELRPMYAVVSSAEGWAGQGVIDAFASFLAWCEARYDCSLPVIPPKPEPLVPFLVERHGERKWANWESALSYQLLGPLPSLFFIKSDGWRRIEGGGA
jgi:hypothetical protein